MGQPGAARGRESLKSYASRTLSVICIGLFAGSCSSDTAVKQGEQSAGAGEPENLPEMTWYPRPKGAVPDRRYRQGYQPGYTQPMPYSGYAPSPGMRGNDTVTQTWPGRFQEYPQQAYERQPEQIWQAPGVTPPAQARGYASQPVMPQYIQRPWGDSGVPNETFNSGPAYEPWHQGYQSPQAGQQGYQQGYPYPQQENPRQVNPWSGSPEWRMYQYDVSPSRSSGHVW